MTPAEKLARSRLAIIEQLRGKDRRRDQRPPSVDDDTLDHEELRTDESSLRRRLSGMSGAARSWWSHHPVQLVIDMATPSLQAYMRRKPFLVLGVAAGLGATLVLTRAWRLISLGTVAVALIKTSQFSGAVMSALSDVQQWQDPGRSDPPSQG